MSEINYSCADVGDHELIPCGKPKFGGISGIALIELDHAITDPSNPAQWTTAINNRTVHLVGGRVTYPQDKLFKAEYPDATPIEGDSLSSEGPDTTLDGFDHVLNFMDGNVLDNNDTFWEGVNTGVFYLAWYNHVNETLTWVNKKCKVVVTPANSPMSKKEKRRYNGKATWTSGPSEFPQLYAAPTGIFN